MERLKNFKTLAYPEIDRKRGFEEIQNSPIFKNYIISEDGKTSGIVVYLKKDERLAEYVKIKDKYLNQLNRVGFSKEKNQIIKNSLMNTKIIKIFTMLEIVKISVRLGMS